MKCVVVHLRGVFGRSEIFDGRTTESSSSFSLPEMGLVWLPIDVIHQVILKFCSLIFVAKGCELVVN